MAVGGDEEGRTTKNGRILSLENRLELENRVTTLEPNRSRTDDELVSHCFPVPYRSSPG